MQPETLKFLNELVAITPNALRVFVCLASACAEDGQVSMGYQAIGDHCFSSVFENAETRKQCARKAVRELEKYDLVERESRHVGTGRTVANAYRVRVSIVGAMDGARSFSLTSDQLVNREKDLAPTIDSAIDTLIGGQSMNGNGSNFSDNPGEYAPGLADPRKSANTRLNKERERIDKLNAWTTPQERRKHVKRILEQCGYDLEWEMSDWEDRQEYITAEDLAYLIHNHPIGPKVLRAAAREIMDKWVSDMGTKKIPVKHVFNQILGKARSMTDE